MKLDLSKMTLPVRVEYEIKGGGSASSLVVFQYSDGKILTASACVLDPEEWESAKNCRSITTPVHSPEWYGKSDEELTEYFKTRGMWPGKIVPDVHVPLSESRDENGVEIMSKPKDSTVPKSVTQIMPEDACSDEEAFGEKE